MLLPTAQQLKLDNSTHTITTQPIQLATLMVNFSLLGSAAWKSS